MADREKPVRAGQATRIDSQSIIRRSMLELRDAEAIVAVEERIAIDIVLVEVLTRLILLHRPHLRRPVADGATLIGVASAGVGAVRSPVRHRLKVRRSASSMKNLNPS